MSRLKHILYLFGFLGILLNLISCNESTNNETIFSKSVDTAISAAKPEDMVIAYDATLPVNFPMGIDDSSKGSIDKKFTISKTEITYELWYKVKKWAEENGYTFKNKGSEGHDGHLQNKSALPSLAKKEPVTKVDWLDAIVWCNAYTDWSNTKKSTSYTFVYTDTSNQVLKDSDSNATSQVKTLKAKLDNTGYRLPSSAEWEFAARLQDNPTNSVTVLPSGVNSTVTVSGKKYWFTKGSFASGATATYTDIEATKEVARFENNSCNAGVNCSINNSVEKNSSKTRNVATLKANSLGIYDMSGNVNEWCFDKGGFGRIIRGGDWGDTVSGSAGNGIEDLQIGKVSSYWLNDAKGPNMGIGFRVVRTLP